MPLTFERKLPIILFFVFLMLTVIGVVFYQNTISMQDAIRLQERAREVVSTVDETEALALEIQSAFSTFMLVSNNTYLDPLERAKPRIRQNIERLRVLNADSADATAEVNRIDQALKEYVSEVSRKIDRRKMEGAAVAADELLWPEGKAKLDQVRLSGERIKILETNRLQQQDLRSDRVFSITVWVLIISSIAGIVGLGVANLTVVSEIRKRRVAQKKLIDVNEGLERSVEQRTAELKRANEKLLEVGLERESILFSEKQARQEAEIANRLRDEFMATVSHELRTPLNSMLGWARLMKGGTLDEAQSERALTTIIKNSETQNRLIEDLLDVARVISGKLQLELTEQDPVEIVSQAVETVRPAAEARHVRTEFDAGSYDGRPIIGDHDRLVQVFTNLLGNAVKFSPDNSAIHVSLANDADNAVISIRDEGKGISPEFLPLVFERFRQDSANRANNGGLGLGLAIVRNLVEMHHGSVSAESEGENKGATFTVILPARSKGVSDNNILEL
ncbi:MAG: ATP-binding protein [Pyrinomonadaceae bacterium]